jgi:2-deoxy-D-gluconate 3-dehydrogenase
MQPFDLSGRVAVVTGGNQGIGFGIAQALARAGAAIVVAGRHAERNVEAVSKLRAQGAQAVAVETDVADEAACRALAVKTVEQLGRLDVLVNNAGLEQAGAVEELALEEAKARFETNFFGVVRMVRAVFRSCGGRGGSRLSAGRAPGTGLLPRRAPVPGQEIPPDRRWCAQS